MSSAQLVAPDPGPFASFAYSAAAVAGVSWSRSGSSSKRWAGHGALALIDPRYACSGIVVGLPKSASLVVAQEPLRRETPTRSRIFESRMARRWRERIRPKVDQPVP